MAWKVWGDRYETGELGDTGRDQPVIFNKDVVLLAVRTWIIVYNDPTFTSLNMKIYSDRAGVQGQLLHTSDNSFTKAEILTEDNGVREIYFEFNAPTGATLKGTDTYRFSLDGSGYVGTTGSHIAWRTAFPDPVYDTNITNDTSQLLVFPAALTFVGAELE